MDSKILILAMIAIAGVYLFGAGISGMVTGESCCSGPECPADQLCDAAPAVQSPAPVKPTLSAVVGIMLLGAASAVYIHRQRTGSARNL